MIHLTLTPSKNASTDLEPTDNTIEDVTALCGEYEVDEEKDGLALIPARFAPCPEGACKSAGKKKCDGELHRLGANVVEMTCLGADLDDVNEEAFGNVLRALQAKGICFWAWETFSHEPNTGTVRARILIPFNEPLPIKHPSQWRDVAWPALIRHVGLTGVAAADSMCKDPARVYYTPRKPSEDAQRDAGFSPGEPLNWKDIIGDALEQTVVHTGPVEVLNEDPDRLVNLEKVREQLKRIKVGQEVGGLSFLLGRVLRGEAPTLPPEKRKDGEAWPSRYGAWRTITAAIANAAEGWESHETLLEVVKASFAAEVADSPNDHTEWETIEGLLDTAMSNAPAHKAQKKAQFEAKVKAGVAILKKKIKKDFPQEPPARPPEPSVAAVEGDRQNTDFAPLENEKPSNPEPVQEPEGDRPDWTDGLLFTQTKHGPQIKNCSANVTHFLEHSPTWRGVFRLNEVTQMVEMHGGPFQKPGQVTLLHDSTIGRVADWFQRLDDQYAMKPSDDTVFSRMLGAAKNNSYDPLKQYLSDLKWDGVQRLHALAKYFNIELTESNEEYVRMILLRWFISAAARGLDPGCKVDTVLILEGIQGAKKTTTFEVLGGGFYTDQSVDIHDKDTWMLTAQSWIVELGELEAFRKSEETALKQFLSQREQKFRLPYGRTIGIHPRRCVFVGTTNRDDYLRDVTGNRRFWPVSCGALDIEALRRDRDQLWAEAVHLFINGGKSNCKACAEGAEARCPEHRWWLTPDEQKLANAETEQRMAPDACAEELVSAILETEPKRRKAEYTMAEIIKLLGLDVGRAQENRVGASIRRAGFVKNRKRVGGERAVFWLVPERLLNAPHAKQSVASQVRQATMPRANA